MILFLACRSLSLTCLETNSISCSRGWTPLFWVIRRILTISVSSRSIPSRLRERLRIVFIIHSFIHSFWRLIQRLFKRLLLRGTLSPIMDKEEGLQRSLCKSWKGGPSEETTDHFQNRHSAAEVAKVRGGTVKDTTGDHGSDTILYLLRNSNQYIVHHYITHAGSDGRKLGLFPNKTGHGTKGVPANNSSWLFG